MTESPENVVAPLPLPSPLDTLADLLRKRQEWEDRFAEAVVRNPLESLTGLLLAGSAVFYAAEVGVNPKIRSFWDALYYITTCASVGYADIFAKTDVGKAVSSLVFTFGPALCAKVFDRPAAPPPTFQPALQAVTDKLDAILVELRALRQG
jgi:hypothetical protein